MSLTNQVQVVRRFQRSIRIDTDLRDPKALEGFICPKSSADVLLTMSGHVQKTQQAAFTWTGPYGSGKSSLVVALSAALNGNAALRDEAATTLGKPIINALWEALPPKTKGWKILPVVGQRAKPAEVIGAALIASGYIEKGRVRRWTDDVLIETLMEIAQEQPRSHGGLVVFLDEMGKFLEGAAQDGEDVYLFQRLAESAARSNGRLIVIGILHQAFDEYAQRLSRELRDEWTKVQGRFVDLVVSVAGDEQLDLLSRAISSNHSKIKKPSNLSSEIATIARAGRPATVNTFALTLEHCWPLHPVVSCLLGPISRRRFGQNQRSLFGFLNSAEPIGFQEFLRDASPEDLYYPDRLWDYLRINLEASILASPDGHRWSMAVEAIERCERTEGATPIHSKLLKTIAILDLFRERSGLSATKELLLASYREQFSGSKIQEALKQIEKWSFVIFRKHMDAFAIYAGSDFDIEQALNEEMSSIREVNFKQLRTFAGLQPVLAKRHYHRTGALRWFDVDLIPLAEANAYLESTKTSSGAMGRFLLVIPTANETKQKATKQCQEIANLAGDDAMIGLSRMSWHVMQMAREFLALTKISEERPELSGDAVAKREVRARMSDARSKLESNLQQMFDTATWYRSDHEPTQYTASELNILASTIADERYAKGPSISNELLNRQKTSPNAVTAQKALLKQMVNNEGQPRLGIEGFPAEGGLFESIIMKAGLYQETENGWHFVAPTKATDTANLLPMWKAATSYLEKHSNRIVKVEELYALWEKPPYGVKAGLLPILAVTLLLARRDKLAFYRDGIFQARFTPLEVDCLTNDPASIQLRWMDLSDLSKNMLSEMAEVVREIDTSNSLVNLEPIDVARGLVAIHEGLKPWTKRTQHLSSNAMRIRNLFKHASDPNKFLFDDIPSLFDAGEFTPAQIITNIREGLHELTKAYDVMLDRLKQMMLTELQVPNTSSQALGELRERAENIRQLSGDFRLNAFVGRLSQFTASQADMEGIASLATNKPAKDWVDADLDQASLEIADLSQKFNRAESFARVKGRKDKRQAMAVVVGITGRPEAMSGEFSVSDSERKTVNDLVKKVEKAFSGAGEVSEHVILAALAEISARYLNRDTVSKVSKVKHS